MKDVVTIADFGPDTLESEQRPLSRDRFAPGLDSPSALGSVRNAVAVSRRSREVEDGLVFIDGAWSRKSLWARPTGADIPGYFRQ